MPISSILDSHGKESASQIFTKPLRAVLGGRQFTKTNDSDQDKAILKVWQRIFVGILLFTVGLPYTGIAAIVLICTPSNKVTKLAKSLSGSESSSNVANEYTRLTPEEQSSLSSLFVQSILNPKQFKTNDTHPQREDLDQTAIQFKEPTFVKVIDSDTDRNCLVIPLLEKKPNATWEPACFYVMKQHPNDVPQDTLWNCFLYGQLYPIAKLMLNGDASDLATLQPWQDLMKGNEVITFASNQYRLRTS